jgi:hypothetical protein
MLLLVLLLLLLLSVLKEKEKEKEKKGVHIYLHLLNIRKIDLRHDNVNRSTSLTLFNILLTTTKRKRLDLFQLIDIMTSTLKNRRIHL